MTRLLTTALTIASALALAGCDELLLYDVSADGRIIAPVDREGHVTAFGQAATPRHLVRLDPATGQIERLTQAPLPLSCPRACGQGVTLVTQGNRLFYFQPGRPSRSLFESERRLIQPTPSPAGDKVAVLEAERPGAPGALYVIDVASGEAGEPISGVLPGFVWSGDALVFARTEQQEAQPFQPCLAEIWTRGAGERRMLFRGQLPGLAILSAPRAGGDALVSALPRPDGTLGLARLSLDGPAVSAGEPVRAVDMWPTCDAGGRVLFTRVPQGRDSIIDGQLRLTALDALTRSVEVPTPGPVRAPRWVGGDGRVAYLTPDDRLVTQRVDGSEVVDWTDRLRVAAGGSP